MTAFHRRLGAAVTATVVAGAGVVITAGPATATVTTLCVGYSGCAKAGMSDAGYGKANGTMYWRMYSGHNCTNYAAYRMVRSGLPNSRPWSGSGNATNWGTAMKSITNSTPAVGAVAWWKAGVYPAGSAGHVAYVEKVVSANEIIVSMDSWRGDFSWARITRTTKGWPSGFVHFNDVRIANRSLPTVSGTPKVGSTLSATTGAWSMTGATYAYQWLANGAVVSGATRSTLALTQALKGKRLSVRVTASAPGYPSASATSAATAAVQAGVITNSTPPQVVGEPQVDSTLSVDPGSWDPAGTAFSYRWQVDGAFLPDATGSTLQVDPSMLGKTIRAEVTATKSGYTAVHLLTAPTAPVEPGVLPQPAQPALAGAPALGSTVRLGALALPAGAQVRVTWARGYSGVKGAAGTAYPVTAADLGHRIRAVIHVTKPGYRQLGLFTPWTKVVRSTPTMRLATSPGTGRLAVRATVRAPGVSNLDGVLQVRSRGRVVRSLPMRDGVVSGTVAGLRPGTRVYRFRVPVTARTYRVVVVRRITVR